MTSPAPRTIALYGGSFNPPHIAHVLVAGWALATGGAEAVWVIPTGGHPFGKPLAPFADRMEMCRRAFGCYGPRAEVLDIEGDDRTHYTIDTLTRLSAEYPDCRFRWLMGSDTLEQAHQWKRFEDVRALAPPLIVPRAGYEAAEHETAGAGDPGNSATMAGFALPDVSSSMIRERIAAGEIDTLAGILPAGVREWIERCKLYRIAPSEIRNSTSR